MLVDWWTIFFCIMLHFDSALEVAHVRTQNHWIFLVKRYNTELKLWLKKHYYRKTELLFKILRSYFIWSSKKGKFSQEKLYSSINHLFPFFPPWCIIDVQKHLWICNYKGIYRYNIYKYFIILNTLYCLWI